MLKSEPVFLPPLHIKLGLTKNFVKALKPDGEEFGYLKQLFPKITDAEIKEGIFVGPQIRQVLKDEVFHSKLSDLESAAWSSFKDLCTGFLGNNRSLD